MIYRKDPKFPDKTRYQNEFEYMFVFSMGKPKVFNPIKVRCKLSGCVNQSSTDRQKDGTKKPVKTTKFEDNNIVLREYFSANLSE